MSDRFTNLYASSLRSTGSLLLKVFFVGAFIMSGIAGFAIDFGRCFGKACGSESNLYLFLLPSLVLIAAYFTFSALKKRQYKRTKALIREEVMAETGTNKPVPDAIFDFLAVSGPQTAETIAVELHIPTEKVMENLRELLSAGIISQQVTQGHAFYTIRP